ncbi:MAG TPA: ABC transporter permease [Steroidobacteraceae bacterium]|nr:ABC transporter permease [Steroidobacteraceae bacterium]
MTVGAILAKRALLSLITLWLLSVMVFAGGQLLPGDVARAILGPLADARAVANLDRQLGLDRPLLIQYWDWISHFVLGDMGQSYVYRASVSTLVLAALGYSVKLGAVAFVLVVPLGVAGGVWAAVQAGRPIDRIISVIGMSATVVPEFVTGIILILIFGVWLKVLPITAAWPPGAGPAVQIYYLLLPSLPLVLVLFGYLARMTRAGTIEALAADYTRTAVLKGLKPHDVLWRHVLRNALLPTITVVATQVGYLMGGLVVVEILFRYPGIGSLIFAAARDKDFPLLEGSVMMIGIIYTLSALAADVLHALLNPRIRFSAAE